MKHGRPREGGKGASPRGHLAPDGSPVIRLLPQGDGSSLVAAIHPDGWSVAQVGAGGGGAFGCLGSGGTAQDKRGPAGDWQLQLSLPT